MSDSRARRILSAAASERNRLRRHLLVAAALREVLPVEPIVVGGTAEEYWTADQYHPTDLDVCVPLDQPGRAILRSLGFVKEGRHWMREGVDVAIEVPDADIDGDRARTVLQAAGGGAARIIGIDDLYLDRLRQATMNETVEDVHFNSALAVCAAGYESIDWRYVRKRIATIHAENALVADAMRRLNAKIRRRARAAIAPEG